MDRQRITPEVAEGNADRAGAYTYNLFPPDGYTGPVFVWAVLGLGVHAHIQFGAGWTNAPVSAFSSPIHYSIQGTFILRWSDWLRLRGILEADDGMRIAEVRKATQVQLDHHFKTKDGATLYA